MTNDRRQFYIKLIKESFSINEVCKKANICNTNGNYKTIKKIIEEEKIDITHFKRQTSQTMKTRKRLPMEEYLQNGTSIQTNRLKKYLIDSNLKDKKCECCGNTEWLGKPLSLQLHHINGINNDNRLENLQLLCPNCHSYTDSYCGKNQKNNIKKNTIKNKTYKIIGEEKVKKINELLLEGKTIEDICTILNSNKNTIKRLLKRHGIKVENTKKELYDLNHMILLMKKYKSFTKVGKELGLSDNAIIKRFKKNGYPYKLKDLIEFLGG